MRSALPSTALLQNAASELGQAVTLSRALEITRSYARNLNGADGATIVLKDGSDCYYADEDAIGPLWKGRRFPQTSCISGWAMMYGRPVVIENIFEDPRIPVEAYRPTFVRSLAMVPVGDDGAVAAIGNYWADHHRATPEEVLALQELAQLTGATLKRLPAA